MEGPWPSEGEKPPRKASVSTLYQPLLTSSVPLFLNLSMTFTVSLYVLAVSLSVLAICLSVPVPSLS